MLSTRQAQRMEEQSGLTMSQVLDLIVLASESGIAVVDQFHDVVLFNPRGGAGLGAEPARRRPGVGGGRSGSSRPANPSRST